MAGDAVAQRKLYSGRGRVLDKFTNSAIDRAPMGERESQRPRRKPLLKCAQYSPRACSSPRHPVCPSRRPFLVPGERHCKLGRWRHDTSARGLRGRSSLARQTSSPAPRGERAGGTQSWCPSASRPAAVWQDTWRPGCSAHSLRRGVPLPWPRLPAAWRRAGEERPSLCPFSSHSRDRRSPGAGSPRARARAFRPRRWRRR